MDGDTIEFLAGRTQQLIAGELKAQIQPDLVKVIGGLGGQTYCHLMWVLPPNRRCHQ